MKKNKFHIQSLKLAISLTFILFAGSLSAQTKLWVSPSGSGTEFSETSPGSLTDTQLNAKIIGLRSSGVKSIEVHLLPGVYPVSETINIGSNLAGKTTDTLRFIGSSTGKAILSGGKKVSGWESIGNGIYRAKLPAGTDFRQLYVNGKMAVRARTPNRNNDEDFGPYQRIKSLNGDDNSRIVMNNTEIDAWKNSATPGEVEMVINQHWVHNREKIKSYSIQGTNAYVSISLPLVYWETTNLPYYWENDLTFLDAEGEWYFDKTSKMVYYKPRSEEDIYQVEVIYPATDRLINIEGSFFSPVRNVFIQNIEFIYSNWTAPSIEGIRSNQGVQPLEGNIKVESMFQVSYANNVHITNCNIFCSGGHGITFATAVKNSEITACHFDGICANGIMLDTNKGANQADAITCDDNKVTHNLIENFGMNYTNGMALYAGCVARLTVANNEVRFGRYGGMQIGWEYGNEITGLHDNLVHNNNVHHVMWLHDDCGGIYTLSRQAGTKIYQNWVHDITRGPWASNYAVAGIYMDNLTSYITVEDNVLYPLAAATTKLFQQTVAVYRPHDNIVRNNDSQDAGIINAAGPKMHTGVELNGGVSGIKETARVSFSVYPNPAGEYLFLNFEEQAARQVTISSLSGMILSRTIVHDKENRIDLSSYVPGVYILNAHDGKQQSTIKFIKR